MFRCASLVSSEVCTFAYAVTASPSSVHLHVKRDRAVHSSASPFLLFFFPTGQRMLQWGRKAPLPAPLLRPPGCARGLPCRRREPGREPSLRNRERQHHKCLSVPSPREGPPFPCAPLPSTGCVSFNQ